MKNRNLIILGVCGSVMVIGGGVYALRPKTVLSNAEEQTTVKTPAKPTYAEILAKAQKDGQKQAAEIKNISLETYGATECFGIGHGKNLAEMDQKSSATVQGVVTNWTKVPEAKNMAVTILSIYVNQGLTAKSKDLVGKMVYVYQQGGFNTRRNLSDGMNSNLSEQQLSEEIFSEREDFPVARIGTELVVNLTKVTKDMIPEGETIIDPDKSYSLGWSSKSMWVKNSADKYQLVNENYIKKFQDQGLPVEGNDSTDQTIVNEINELMEKNDEKNNRFLVSICVGLTLFVSGCA
ncbi:hypothetical protein [Xylocopilactobacillus apicola]|uniref:Uncharacterized protein n=1 Tax=Xylocopilactobacillus apicola TaxID=2932184 RepID=A0AAU9D9U7_9LACO|nr:hypothetical protein [Xylocopilactobacillus apicola]BDR59201.1 hypothetical protein XA3_16420 [Xylocopilactobacillus apicola]